MCASGTRALTVTAPHPFAQYAAGAHGLHGPLLLVAGILQDAWIIGEHRLDSRPLVVLHELRQVLERGDAWTEVAGGAAAVTLPAEPEQRREENAGREQDGEMAFADPRDIDHHQRRRDEREHGAEVGLLQDQGHGHARQEQ